VFEDFKVYLQEKLSGLVEEQLQSVRQFQEDDRRSREGTGDTASDDKPPLVRVALRAGQANEIWEPVFDFVYLQQNVLLDELGPDGSFADKHEAEPCHGFLVLCDEQAQVDDSLSPRSALAECRQIQSQMSDVDQLPPVAIIFRNPPAPAWSRLLKSTPRCLHRVLGENLEEGLTEFLEQVREVRRATT
jgi:hypothetical protein